MSVDVGPSAEFAEHRLRLVKTGRRQIGIVRWDGALYAVNNYCTHQGGPLCLGVLSGRLESDGPGAMSLDTTRPVLACPWHGWEFDLRTGRALPDPATRIRTYPVREVGGRVLVDVDGHAAAPEGELPVSTEHARTAGAA
jgi:nitrite reductase/ring-hydroxylating ferredoxin subunit